MSTTIEHKLDKYLLKNGITDFNNEKTRQFLKNTMIGGFNNSCSSTKNNSNIFNWTMQKLNSNQRTLVAELKGGRVTLPSQYFGSSRKTHTDNPSFTVMGDVTPAQIRPSLTSSFNGGGSCNNNKQNLFTMKDVKEMLGGHGNLTTKEQKMLYQNYNQNLKSFVEELKLLQSGGGDRGKRYTQKAITDSFKKLQESIKV